MISRQKVHTHTKKPLLCFIPNKSEVHQMLYEISRSFYVKKKEDIRDLEGYQRLKITTTQ